MREFTDYFEFKEFVGMLDHETNWDSIGIEPDEDCHYFSTNRLDELKNFVSKNNQYHIITQTSDGDDNDCHTYDNSIRIINRLSYCLGSGSKDPAYLSEPFALDNDK